MKFVFVPFCAVNFCDRNQSQWRWSE